MKNPEKQIDTDEGDREQRANGLLRFLNFAKNIEPLEGRSFEEAFDTEEHKREFISSLDAEGFIALLNGLNGILRDKDKKDWAMDGKFVGVKGNFFLSPFLEDKPELIGQVLSAMQRMNSEGKSLDDIAVLVASCINAIHPYANGNGRTSRFVYTVIANNEKQLTENQREKVLLDSGRDLIDVNPASVQNKILNIVSNNAGLNDKEVNPNNLQRIFAHKLELNVDGLRGDIVTNRASKALACFEGRKTVTPQDIFRIIPLCLRHRLRKDPLESIDSGEKVQETFKNIFGYQ
jgi:hypothetical protein